MIKSILKNLGHTLKILVCEDRDFYFFCLKGSRYRKTYTKTYDEIFQKENIKT